MDLRSAPPPAPTENETFCRYLALQLVAKQGFVPGAPPEAREIAEQSDIALYFTDGYAPVIIGMIDREAHPEKTFALSAMQVSDIGDACRALAGRISTAKMPVTIHLMEVGPAADDFERRLGYIKPASFFSKVLPSAWSIDPQRAAIRTTAGYRARSLRRFIQQVLDSPREAVVAPEPVALAPQTFPWLTAAAITALVAIFAAEVVYGVGGVDRLKQPTLATLRAFGGLMGERVAAGEWYRLFTAPLLHGGFEHIALNAVSLGIAGYVLEPLIGRAWLAALFVVGAICGSLASLAYHADNIISVGASGAAMALFACMLVLSRHFPKGAMRTRLQTNAIYVLLPSLLPLASLTKGAKVDYAAHFGGALGGVAIGLVLLGLWRSSDTRPRLRLAAAAIALAGLAVFLYSGAMAQRDYPIYELGAALAPDGAIPANDEAARRQSADLVARYPRDPRTQYSHAITLLRANDAAGAEKALRAALAEEDVWRRAITGGDLPERIHVVLALLLLENGRRGEAKDIAQPACRPGTRAQLRAALDQQRLCE